MLFSVGLILDYYKVEYRMDISKTMKIT